jgi:hypothetical protein
MQHALDDSRLLLRLDPANADTRGVAAIYAGILGNMDEELGRPRTALGAYGQSLDILLASEHGAADHGDLVLGRYAAIARINDDIGEGVARDAAIKAAESALVAATASMGKDSFKTQSAGCSLASAKARIALLNGNPRQAVAVAAPTLGSGLRLSTDHGRFLAKLSCVANAALTIGNAQLALGDYAAARAALAPVLPLAAAGNDYVARNFHAQLAVLQAIAMARLGQAGEARALISPIVEWQRGRFAHNRDDAQQRLDYASALYALALAETAGRNENLARAAAIIAALPAEMRTLKSTKIWQGRVGAERSAAPIAVSGNSAT